MTSHLRLGLTAALILAGGVGALAAAAAPTATTAAVAIQRMIACHAKPEDHDRLACYDAVVADLIGGAQAEPGADKPALGSDVLVIDREQVRAARRQAFGFDLSALSVFDRGEKPETLDRVSTTVERAYQQGDGHWVLDMANGAEWVQTDEEKMWRNPAKGSKAEIRKAAIGSYFINIDGQRAIRARRVK
ncbi:hypothetical protein [Phenylobacterium aquaticum]|uniref:hypothetical protein n=4 Tax=Phenylobacterium aquaticum TaxID=1763816 RepID=UPI0026EC42A1|nr:hypothetical protein [Phenylobacterium aquaticum]